MLKKFQCLENLYFYGKIFVHYLSSEDLCTNKFTDYAYNYIIQI